MEGGTDLPTAHTYCVIVIRLGVFSLHGKLQFHSSPLVLRHHLTNVPHVSVLNGTVKSKGRSAVPLLYH